MSHVQIDHEQISVERHQSMETTATASRGGRKRKRPRGGQGRIRKLLVRLDRNFGAANGLLVVAGFYAVGRWQSGLCVGLFFVWLPLLFGLSTLASRRRQIVDELRTTPLWFIVSRYGEGYRLELDDQWAQYYAGLRYIKDEAHFFCVGGVHDFECFGVHTKIVEVDLEQLAYLRETCTKYLEAKSLCKGYFGLSWTCAVALAFLFPIELTELLLATMTWAVVLWGVLPRLSLDDHKTESYEFVCQRQKHIHVYSEYPDRCECICGARPEVLSQ